MKNTVVVFARAPRLGTVKKRLARGIGDRAALRFYTGTLVRLLRGLTRERRFRTVLALTPDGARDRLPLKIPRIMQGRGDIGRRMDTAMRRFPRGNVAIVGSDIPDAGAGDLLAAFCALGRHDAVFGPAEDGGYWLVALGPRRPARLAWARPAAARQAACALRGRLDRTGRGPERWRMRRAEAPWRLRHAHATRTIALRQRGGAL